jgi:hypothetical protein
MAWLLGAAILAAVVAAAVGFSEEREFLTLAQEAESAWLLLALLRLAAEPRCRLPRHGN